MTMRFLAALALFILTTVFVGCEGAPTRPSPSVVAPTVTVAAPVAPPVWPVAHPDGQFGHEDPRVPPAVSLCPVDYWPRYNGWNWLCEGPYPWLREFPSTRWRAAQAEVGK